MSVVRAVGSFAAGAVFGVAGSFALGAWSRSTTVGIPCDDSAAVEAARLATSSLPAASLTTMADGKASTTFTTTTEATAASVQAPVSTTADLPPDTPEAIAMMPPNAVNNLLIPVVGVTPSDLADTFTQSRSEGRVHDAVDIVAPRNTPVVAANDGRVVKLFTSVRGGLTAYQFDPQDKVIYYYAHLDRYAPALAEGEVLHRGDPIGFVGSTGNASADAPHLHFEIEMMGPKQQWWHGTSINPFGRFAGQKPHADVLTDDH